MSEAKDPADKEAKANVFKNDGSFLELFKKMQEEEAAKKLCPVAAAPSASAAALAAKAAGPSSSSAVALLEEPLKPPPVLVGKRRGGRVLKTGQVKKQKSDTDESVESPPKDAWSAYMAEVKKYQSTTCEEEGKNRPLVK